MPKASPNAAVDRFAKVYDFADERLRRHPRGYGCEPGARPRKTAYIHHDREHDSDEFHRLFDGPLSGELKVSYQLERLKRLAADWDGEGAPKPSRGAIAGASKVVAWVTAAGLEVTDVDADVLGGVAVYLHGSATGRSAWIACMNDGTSTVVLSSGRAVEDSAVLTDNSREGIVTFLNEHA